MMDYYFGIYFCVSSILGFLIGCFELALRVADGRAYDPLGWGTPICGLVLGFILIPVLLTTLLFYLAICLFRILARKMGLKKFTDG